MMEALKAMEELVGPTSRKLIAKFGSTDVDGSGSLDKTEFTALYHQLLAQPEGVAAAYRAPLPPPQVVAAPPPPPPPPTDAISSLFKKYESSGDGTLSMLEALKAMEE